MTRGPIDALASIDELNHMLDADPALALNMEQHGYIKRQGFHHDHNGNLTTKWELTELGRRELMTRLHDGLKHALRHGQEKLQ